jgi:hypothetical protein
VEKNCKVPIPLKLNCWKHHALYIKKEISKFKSEAQIKGLQSLLVKIGESQMDLYYGKLSPAEIAQQTIEYLAINSLKNKNEYSDWLCSVGNEYKTIALNDRSVWTLRSGDEEKRFVHIHPGRYSPHTVRVKALTLKSVISVLAYLRTHPPPSVDIYLINEVRKKYLNAPPVKSFSKENGLGKLIILFDNLKE